MSTFFMVSVPERFLLECLYYGNSKENAVRSFQEMRQGDLLEVMDQGKYIIGIGWYVMITINSKETVYISIQQLEKAIQEKKIYTLIELELEYCCLKYQIDQALDCKNKELFMKAAKEYKKFLSLKEKSSRAFSVT
ncbi:IDEAL domain-containing protein [Evansella caseinilytica]|uniref:IDEAL domain-containing protein n=1 Tax=Evansella caseinilytica TaxID=1503961 RepID=A0A1H3RZU8_9BACI|nr:IDEAL domain-containing protein [Evansella caseinilytica]SDZ30825.1 IDEAL domain-containing protein [Evansella caseinilytica]